MTFKMQSLNAALIPFASMLSCGDGNKRWNRPYCLPNSKLVLFLDLITSLCLSGDHKSPPRHLDIDIFLLGSRQLGLKKQDFCSFRKCPYGRTADRNRSRGRQGHRKNRPSIERAHSQTGKAVSTSQDVSFNHLSTLLYRQSLCVGESSTDWRITEAALSTNYLPQPLDGFFGVFLVGFFVV